VLSEYIYFLNTKKKHVRYKNTYAVMLQALLSILSFSLLSVLTSCTFTGMCFPWVTDAHASKVLNVVETWMCLLTTSEWYYSDKQQHFFSQNAQHGVHACTECPPFALHMMLNCPWPMSIGFHLAELPVCLCINVMTSYWAKWAFVTGQLKETGCLFFSIF